MGEPLTQTSGIATARKKIRLSGVIARTIID
jgi:hypothetical protein